MATSEGPALRVLLGCDFFLRYTARLAGGLAENGSEVALLTRDHDLEFGAERGAAREFVAAATGTRVVHHRVEGRVRSPRGAFSAVRLRRVVKRFDPEVVHLQESIGNDVRLLFAGGVRRGDYALTVHDPVRHPGDDVAWKGAFGNRALIAAAGLIFVHGEALREELIALAAPKAPVVVVPHGIDPGAPQPLPDRPGVLFFGRISYYKGLDVLLDAMAEVWQKVPEATLTVAGAGDIAPHPALDDSRVVVRAEHIPDDEVPALVAGSTCVALPYRQASQSGVGSLVKRHARPLVATSVGGLPELVADGSGLVVPPEDPGALARALVSLLEDRGLARRLGDAGSRTAEQEAGWSSVAQATLRAYREHLMASRS